MQRDHTLLGTWRVFQQFFPLALCGQLTEKNELGFVVTCSAVGAFLPQ